jgi:hypothetical protein
MNLPQSWTGPTIPVQILGIVEGQTWQKPESEAVLTAGRPGNWTNRRLIIINVSQSLHIDCPSNGTGQSSRLRSKIQVSWTDRDYFTFSEMKEEERTRVPFKLQLGYRADGL